jgi:Phage phiEco32-like COOH.NH2 ligase-type 2
LDAKAAVEIDLIHDMKHAPVDVKQFGCEPSWCAHDEVTKIPPIDAISHPWRYAGAHLHFSPSWDYYSGRDGGWDYEVLNTPEEYPTLVKLFDQYIGLPLTCLFHSKEQYLRRRFYGQAGEYRPQVYGPVPNSKETQRGVEYRTPGPELWNTVWLPSLIMGIGRDIIQNYSELKTLDKHRIAAVRHAIDTGEDRWKLLKSFRTDSVLISPATWKRLYLKFKAEGRSPDGVISAIPDRIYDGFRGWYNPRKYGDNY